MTPRLALLALGIAACLAACVEPKHLTYDFGRAYTAAFGAQPDLTRPSVANQQYPLYGIEGVQIRLLVQSATTTDKTGVATIQQGN